MMVKRPDQIPPAKVAPQKCEARDITRTPSKKMIPPRESMVIPIKYNNHRLFFLTITWLLEHEKLGLAEADLEG